MRRVLHVLAWMVVLCTLGTPGRDVRAAPSDADLGDLAGLVELFPQARDLPPPTWLALGVRASYSGASANFGGGGAAASLTQFDVVAADGNQISVYGHAYGDLGTGVLPLGGGRVVGYTGIGPFWIHPSVLVDAESFSGGSLTVTRYDKGGGQIVVRFQTQTANGQTVVEIDAATGVLVFSSITIPGSASQFEHLDTRSLPLPWMAERAPNWVREGASLEYQGIRATTIPASGTVEQVLGSTAAFVEGGARWAEFDSSFAIDGAPQGTSRTINGGAQIFGALWVPRSALLAELPSASMQIDSDAFSGAVLFVHRRASDDAIVLRTTTAASETVLAYDAQFGALREYSQTQDQGTAVIEDTLIYSGGADLEALGGMPEVPDDPPFPDEPSGDDSGGDESGGGESAGDESGMMDPTAGSEDTGNDSDESSAGSGAATGGADAGTDTEGSGASSGGGSGCSIGERADPMRLAFALLLLGLGRRRSRAPRELPNP